MEWWSCFASKYTGVTGATAPYNLGRTATHEGTLFKSSSHLGDATCGNDFVADTPTQTGSNGGSPTYPLYNTCGGYKICNVHELYGLCIWFLPCIYSLLVKETEYKL